MPAQQMFHFRDLPKYEAIRQRVSRYPDLDPRAFESFLVLLRVASDVLAALEAYLARHDLSLGRFSVLMVLNRDPDQSASPSDLADRCGVTRGTMTAFLASLEREKLVTRTKHTGDKRMSSVKLTKKGIARLDGMCSDYYGRIAKLMGELQDGDKVNLEQMLFKVNKGIPALLAQ